MYNTYTFTDEKGIPKDTVVHFFCKRCIVHVCVPVCLLPLFDSFVHPLPKQQNPSDPVISCHQFYKQISVYGMDMGRCR